ncbi:PhoP/PhoQ regulatory lipoprotein MgrB [Yersinia pestis]|uniref:PhoP/PhoQ regulator MgrB n=1 Tax=Yersinia pestis TaxID=632 RepID=UPI000E306AE6|nr:PhoP/PhoQ regulator MgrB [Yersinia pestis]
MNITKLVTTVVIIAACRLLLVACCLLLVACCLFYLLALDSYCDQGGTFSTGICAITTIVPW